MADDEDDFMNPDWGIKGSLSPLFGPKQISQTQGGLSPGLDLFELSKMGSLELFKRERPDDGLSGQRPAIVIHAETLEIGTIFDDILKAASAAHPQELKKKQITVVYAAPAGGRCSQYRKPRSATDFQRIRQFPRFYSLGDFQSSDFPNWIGRHCFVEITDLEVGMYGLFIGMLDGEHPMTPQSTNPYEDDGDPSGAHEAWKKRNATVGDRPTKGTVGGSLASPKPVDSVHPNQGVVVSNSELKGKVTEYRGILHNLTGKRKNFVHHFIDAFYNQGITNLYIIAGGLGTAGKESGFSVMSERGGYYPRHIYAKTMPHPDTSRVRYYKLAVPNRVLKRLREQSAKYGYPTKAQIQELIKIRKTSNGNKPKFVSKFWTEIVKGGKPGDPHGIALFNVAYGYSPNQETERLTLDKYKVVDRNGRVNPALFNPKLAGWKYRGRGSIQTTFRTNYRIFATKAGGADTWAKVQKNPDLVSTHVKLACEMSVGQVRFWTNRILNKYFKGVNISSINNVADGCAFTTLSAYGPGSGKAKPYWAFRRSSFQRTYSRAMKKLNKHIRVKDSGPALASMSPVPAYNPT